MNLYKVNVDNGLGKVDYFITAHCAEAAFQAIVMEFSNNRGQVDPTAIFSKAVLVEERSNAQD